MTSPTTRFTGKLIYVRFKDFTLFMDDLEVWFHGREIERHRFDNSAVEKFIEEARETLRLKEIGLPHSFHSSVDGIFSAAFSGSSPGVPSAPPQPFSTSSSFSPGVPMRGLTPLERHMLSLMANPNDICLRSTHAEEAALQNLLQAGRCTCQRVDHPRLRYAWTITDLGRLALRVCPP